MNEAIEKFDQTLAEIRSGVEGAFVNGRPRVPYASTEEATEPREPEPVLEPPYQPEHEAQLAPEVALPATMIDWIYLLHGQLAYLDANMLRIERFLGMGDRPRAP
jgi:hypothetical protein